MIVYVYEGERLYPEDAVDHDPVTGKPDSDGYERYEIKLPVTLTGVDLFNGETLLEVLIRSGQAKRL
jgi:hypothetical protein